MAQTGTAVSVEGGFACSNTKESVFPNAGSHLGERGCGGTGAVEIANTGKPVFSIFDHWALRGRLTRFNDKQDAFVFSGNTADMTFADRRVAVDAEVGTKLPFSFFGVTPRITLGLRYADYAGEQVNNFTAGPSVGNVSRTTYNWSGVGPRIGLRSATPLGTHWMIESRSGLAVMFGQHTYDLSVNGTTTQSSSNSGTVYSLESSTALAYKVNGNDAGPVFSVGLLSEYWFDQVNIKSVPAQYDRHSWGPFARVRVPMQ